MTNHSSPTTSRSAWIIITLAFAMFVVLEQLTPFQYDNLVFESAYLKNSDGSAAFSIDAFLRYINEIRTGDNFRIANILAPIFSLIIPCKLIFSIATGFMAAATIWCVSQLSMQRSRVDSPSVSTAWLGIIIFLPWRNNILTGDYALNYIFSGAIALALLWSATNSAYGDRRYRYRWGLAAVFLSIILGAWHEGFALPISAGLLGWCALRRFRTPAVIPLTAILCASTAIAWILLSPAHFNRGVNEISLPAIIESPVKSVINNCLTMILAALIALSSIIKRLRPHLRMMAANPTFVILSLAALCGTALSWAIIQSGRTAYLPQLCALTALMTWFAPIADRLPKHFKTITTITITTGLTTLGIYCAIWCHRLMVQYNRIIDNMHQSASGQVFYDIIFPEDVPLLTLGLPSKATFIEPFSYWVIDSRYPRLQSAVVPTALDTNLREINPYRFSGGIMQVDGALFTDTPPTSLTLGKYGTRYGITLTDITLSDGKSIIAAPTFFIRFADTSNTNFYYLKPININSKHITNITLTN